MHWDLRHIQVTCGNESIPTATVRLIGPDGQELVDASVGVGPVDAAYKAINRILEVPNTLKELSIASITEGTDAIGYATVNIENEGKVYSGSGSSKDIVVACAEAYIDALNKVMAVMSVPS